MSTNSIRVGLLTKDMRVCCPTPPTTSNFIENKIDESVRLTPFKLASFQENKSFPEAICASPKLLIFIPVTPNCDIVEKVAIAGSKLIVPCAEMIF